MIYCCENKCFETPRDQVDGIACTKCYNFCYCICNCIKTKMQDLINNILEKAKNLAKINQNIIGIKIYNKKGYIITNCIIPKILYNNSYYEQQNYFFKYDESLVTIPRFSLSKDIEIVEKTPNSIEYIIKLN